MYSIIKRCLRVDPEDRPDAKTLLDMIPCYPVEPQVTITYRRQILTSKVDPRSEIIRLFIMAIDHVDP